MEILKQLEGNEVRYATLILATLPLSMIYYELFTRRSYPYRHIYTVIAGALLVWLMWGWTGLIHGVLHIFLAYGATRLGIDPMLVLAACMVHLCAGHFYMQIWRSDHSYDGVDWTTLLMILVERSSWIAFSGAAHNDSNNNDRTDGGASSKKQTEETVHFRKTLSKEQQQLASSADNEDENVHGFLGEPKTALSYIAYCFLFPGLLSLPAGSYMHYMHLGKAKHRKGDRRSRYRRALFLILGSAICMIGTLFLKSKMPISGLHSKQYFASPFWYQLLYLHLSQMAHRLGYYFVWLLGEASYVLMGFGNGPHWYHP